jgi:hypothetical protein
MEAQYRCKEPYNTMGWAKPTVQLALALSTGLLGVEAQYNIRHPLGLSSSIVCQYPREWQSCNTPTSRDCWIRKYVRGSGKYWVSQFDISTDCEKIQSAPEIMHQLLTA